MKNKKAKILTIVGIVTFLLATIGGTFAYFIAQGGSSSSKDVTVTTATTDSLVFDMGSAISITADEKSFAQGKPNREGSTTATARAKAGSATALYHDSYNMFIVIDNNNFEYTTEDKKVELALNVEGPNGEVKSIPGLKYVEGIGFDITNKRGSYAIALNHVIETDSTKIDNWKITITLINLDSDQNDNAGKELVGKIYITKDDMDSYSIPKVNTIEAKTNNGVELEVEAKTTSGTEDIAYYYYGIEEAPSQTYTLKKAKARTVSTIEYEKSTSPNHKFTNLKPNTAYNVYIYTEDTNGFTSDTYQDTLTTSNYEYSSVTNVEISEITTSSLKVTATATKGQADISKYYFSCDNGENYTEEATNEHTCDNLESDTMQYIKVYVEDTNKQVSNVYDAEARTKGAGTTLVNYVKGLYTTQGANSLYHHDGTLENGINDGSYRYSGAYEEVNNWVCFGSNEEKCPANNLYRIIGVFNEKVLNADGSDSGKTDERVKLIMNDYPGESVLGKAQDGTRTPYSSFTGASKPSGDQPGYAWSGSKSVSSNSWLTSTFNTETLNGLTGNTYLTILGSEWTNKIALTEWKVGGTTSGNITSVKAATTYQNEIVSPAKSTTVAKKVGLMYAHDYGFAASKENWTTILGSYNNDTNRNNNWLYRGLTEWTLYPDSSFSSSVFSVNSNGHLIGYDTAYNGYATRPSFYLEASVTYANGEGTEGNPIRIG